MIYTVKRANLVAEQLRKFSDSNSWMVVGQFVNIEFWIEEVKNALQAIDDHNSRFDKMYEAQKEWIESHGTQVPDNCPICQGICELGNGVKKPNLPKKSPETKSDKKESRIELLNSAYYLLLRCYKLKLISEADLRTMCVEIGTRIDLNDLESYKT